MFTNYTYDLSHREMRLLAFIALITLDEDSPDQPARCFYGGQETLATALGRQVPAEPDKHDDSPEARRARADRAAAFQAVKTALAALVEAGALTQTRRAIKGRQTAEYRLNVEVGPRAGRERPGKGAQRSPPAQHVIPSGTKNVPNRSGLNPSR